MIEIQLIATDLDGTFLKNDRTISPKNIQALKKLGEKNITRVVATGRNLRKVKEVLPDSVPFDYIVYSSGAGVYNWQNKTGLFNQNIKAASVQKLLMYFIQHDLNFYAFKAAPNNHKMWVKNGKENCEEFNRYQTFHKSFVTNLPENAETIMELCQFLLIIRENESHFLQLKNDIESQCNEIRVIRSSSPVTKGYIWVEVFHRSVSKGHGVKQICEMLKIDKKNTLGIGNDYNDLDLLNFTAHSFLTENAPKPIKAGYLPAPSNEEDAFSHVVQPLVW